MRTFILLAACLALGSAKPRALSKQALSTPLARGSVGIVGGEDAEVGEFPHQIALTRGVGGSLMCGGSLVAPNKVVTAGHCCEGMKPNKLGVDVGSHHLNKQDPDQKSIAVTAVNLHEDYDSWTVYNDICTLDLAEESDEGTESLFLDGEPPALEATWPRSCRRSPSQS